MQFTALSDIPQTDSTQARSLAKSIEEMVYAMKIRQGLSRPIFLRHEMQQLGKRSGRERICNLAFAMLPPAIHAIARW